MNFSHKIIFYIFIIIISSGCGRAGEDGEIFLRFRTILTPFNFFIDNPDIPENFQYDVYYKTSPGSYPFTYTDHLNQAHPLPGEFGVLDIVAEPGESGSLFRSGQDGQDLYIDLILLSTGPIIENFEYFTIASSLNYDE